METGEIAPTPAEEWRKCTFCPDYEVSSLGRVRSLDRMIKKKNGWTQKRVGQMLIPGTCNRKDKQYHFVVINGVARLLHRVVALAFLPNPANLRTVDHIDRNRLNNAVSNLKWASHSENNCNKSTKPKSGHSYIYWRERDKLWYVRSRQGGKYVINKAFKTIEDALAARKEALGI